MSLSVNRHVSSTAYSKYNEHSFSRVDVSFGWSYIIANIEIEIQKRVLKPNDTTRM
jgi:hypothetical protein